eukprot:COSAG03_NODE_16110_length_411_cov_1.144231_1_plen_32_part_10
MVTRRQRMMRIKTNRSSSKRRNRPRTRLPLET